MVKKEQTYGFTLLEVGIVVAVTAILGTTALLGKGFVDVANMNKALQTIQRVHDAANQYAAKASNTAFSDTSPNELNSVFERGYLQRQGGLETIKIAPGLELSALFMTRRINPDQNIIAITLGPLGGLSDEVANADPLDIGMAREFVRAFLSDPKFISGINIPTTGSAGMQACSAMNSGRSASTVVLCFKSEY